MAENDVLKMAEQDADDEGQRVTADKLSFISNKINEMLNLQDRISQVQEELASLQAQFNHLNEKVIPTYLVEDCGLEGVKLPDGTKIDVGKVYLAGITEEKKPEAFTWLEKNGHDDLIKTEVTITYPRKFRKQALAMVKRMEKAKTTRSIKLKESVHPQTLRAFVKEQINDGAPLPHETFGVYVKRTTKITKP